MAIWLTSGGGLATVAGVVTVAAITTVVVWKNTEPDPDIQAQQPLMVLEHAGSDLSKPASPVVVENTVASAAVENPVTPANAANEPVATNKNVAASQAPTPAAEPTTKPVVLARVEPSAPLIEKTKTPASAVENTAPDVAPDVFDTPARPVLDLVRVDAQGSAIVAGTTQPGATVRIRLGEDTLQSVQADANGSFVALLDLPTSAAPRPLVLEGIDGGKVVPSAETVLVMPFAKDNSIAPKLVVASAKGVTVLQDNAAQKNVPQITTAPAPVAVDVQGTELSAPAAIPEAGASVLSLDTIAYDKTGDVVLAGRGQSDQQVRVYLNNKPIQTETVRSDGQWQVVLPEVQEGVHTLRVDATNAAGKVSARVESPFKRETPDVVAAADQGSITVQPGHTLWALAQDKYGDGVKYVQIFQANRDRIRNPDLIYPGQVFELPK